MKLTEARGGSELRDGDVAFNVSLDEIQYPLESALIQPGPRRARGRADCRQAGIAMQKPGRQAVSHRLNEDSAGPGLRAHLIQYHGGDLLNQRVAKAGAIEQLGLLDERISWGEGSKGFRGQIQVKD